MYQRVGSYEGKLSLQEVARRLGVLDVTWAGTDYFTTTDHVAAREAIKRDFDGVIPGEWHSAMLVVVQPGGQIPPHVDAAEAEGLVRYHIVLETNSRSWNLHAGERQQLEEGGIYIMDPLVEHSSGNEGETPRIHLVVDVRRTHD